MSRMTEKAECESMARKHCSQNDFASLPNWSSGRRAAARTQAAIRLRRPNGNGLRWKQGQFGLCADIERRDGGRQLPAICANPTRHHSLGKFFDPLLEQCGDFFPQMCGVIQARKLEAFERWSRGLVKIVPWRSDPVGSHVCPPNAMRLVAGLLTHKVIAGHVIHKVFT